MSDTIIYSHAGCAIQQVPDIPHKWGIRCFVCGAEYVMNGRDNAYAKAETHEKAVHPDGAARIGPSPRGEQVERSTKAHCNDCGESWTENVREQAYAHHRETGHITWALVAVTYWNGMPAMPKETVE